jgi:hypothetical protein
LINTIKFLGKCIVDNAHLQNRKLTKTEMDSIDNTVEQPWIYNSIFIANYDNNLYSGNMTGWRLKRKLSTDTLFKVVKEFPWDTLQYTDREVKNYSDYIYAIHSLASAGEGLGVQNTVHTNFYGWFLFDDENSYKFDAGFDSIQTDKIQVVGDVHVYNNYSQYPVFSYGKRNYKTSSITTLPYKFNDNQFVVDVALLKEIETFINNQKPKILKNTAGEMWKVNTSDFSYKYEDKLYQQPFTITFTWTEIDSTDSEDSDVV